MEFLGCVLIRIETKSWISFLESNLIASLRLKNQFIDIYLVATTVTTYIVGKGSKTDGRFMHVPKTRNHELFVIK